MADNTPVLIAITIMASIVYLTRVSGYFAGLRLRHIAGIQPILEVLPGCAFMAILAPAVRQGSASELLAMACLVVIMWRTDNVALATIVGMGVLFAGNSLLG